MPQGDPRQLSQYIKSKISLSVESNLNLYSYAGIDPALANEVFAFGVQHTNNIIVKKALELGANIETLVNGKPPLFYLCGVNPRDIPAATTVAKTLLDSGASLTKHYNVHVRFLGDIPMDVFGCLSMSQSDNEKVMYNFLKDYQQTHPDLQAGDEVREHEGAAAGVEPFHAPGGPRIEEDFQKLGGEDFAQGPGQD